MGSLKPQNAGDLLAVALAASGAVLVATGRRLGWLAVIAGVALYAWRRRDVLGKPAGAPATADMPS